MKWFKNLFKKPVPDLNPTQPEPIKPKFEVVFRTTVFFKNVPLEDKLILDYEMGWEMESMKSAELKKKYAQHSAPIRKDFERQLKTKKWIDTGNSFFPAAEVLLVQYKTILT